MSDSCLPMETHYGHFYLYSSKALAYLYSAAALANVRPENARSVLAAACLLGRMDDLCNYAYEVCRQSISLESLPSWLEFVDSVPTPTDGSSTPIIEQHQSPRTAVFGPYAQRLRDDVFNFLVVTLPNLVNFGGQATPTTPLPEGASSHADAGRETLLQVFARVPFDLFKAAVESPTFQLGSLLRSFPALVYLHHRAALSRVDALTLQIRQRRDRAPQAGHCTGTRRRGNGRARLRRKLDAVDGRACHPQAAPEAALESQQLVGAGLRGVRGGVTRTRTSYS